MRIDTTFKYGLPALSAVVVSLLASLAPRLPVSQSSAFWFIAFAAAAVPLFGFWILARRTQSAPDLRSLIAHFEEIPIPLLVVDAGYHVVIANAPFRELLGTSTEELGGTNALQALPLDWAERLQAQYEALRGDAIHAQGAPSWLPRPRKPPVFVRIRSMAMANGEGRWILSFFEDLSDSQRNAEEQAVWSERVQAFVQRLIDVIPMPVYLKDQHSRLVMINSTFAAARAADATALLGKTPFELAPNEEHARLTIEEDQQVLGGASIVKEERTRNPVTGETIYRMVTKGSCLDAAGHPVIVGANFDVTRWRRAEEALTVALQRETDRRERTQQYIQRLIDVIPQPVYVKDARSRLVMMNEASVKEWNLPREQLIGRTPAEIAPDNLRARNAVAEDVRVLAGLAVRKEEFAAHWSTGENRYRIVTKGSCLNDEGERVIVCANFDVTELRTAERSLQAALEVQSRTRAFLQTTFDALPNPVAVMDMNLRYIMTNQAWGSTFGANTPGQALWGRAPERFSDMIHQTDGTVREIALSLPRDDGEVSHYIARGTVTTDLNGNRVLLCVYADITSIKQAEEASMRAREAAERANEAKSLFLANISHEVRTPMHAVLSFARLGQEKTENDAALKRVHGYFERIVSSGERLMTMLDSVLDFSKLEAGRQQARRVPMALRPLIDDVIAEFAALLSIRQQVIVVFAHDYGHVSADETLMSQVLRNLISNAIKFSPEGQSIDIRMDRLEHGDKAWIQLIVADRGVGIPDNELEAVFDKFVQSSTTRTGAGGTGLGLAICKEIVKLHEGEIFVRNRDGGGAEFVLRIPALKN